MPIPVVTVSIDTEEDNWGSYSEKGATTENIGLLPRLQDVFDKWGVRPTYLVNRPPLVTSPSVGILGDLAARESVEIGAHCHPWNTPPDVGSAESMLYRLPPDLVHAKVVEIKERLGTELGVRPRTFRAGRWGYGATVARALHEEGFLADASLTPFIDWTSVGGPDYSDAPNRPYRFHPDRPMVPDPTGIMVELPTTVGFLRGQARKAAALRTRLERSAAARMKVVAVLDQAGLLARRWLSPESTSLDDMMRLADAELRHDKAVLDVTFHSCTLLPGATPFVRDREQQHRFLQRVDGFFKYCSEQHLSFKTLGEVANGIMAGSPSADTAAGADVPAKRRALLVTYHFPPARAVGALRPARLAEALPKLGYEVDVVCAGPPDASDESGSRVAGRLWRVDTPFVFGRNPDKLPRDQDMLGTLWWKVRAYVEWLFLTRDWSWNWGAKAVSRVVPELTESDYDLLIADAPPRPSIAPFVRWARRQGIPVVLDLRDIWAFPDESKPLWWPLHPQLRRAAWEVGLRDEAMRSAEQIVVTSPEMAQFMAERVPAVDVWRFTSIPNAYRDSDVDADAQINVGTGTAEDPFTLVYTGSLAYGRDQQVEALVRALAYMRANDLPTVELHLAGGGAHGPVELARREGIADQVRTYGFVSREDALALQRKAGALLLLQPDDKIGTRVAIPAKLFEYMARRRAILALVGNGPANRVVTEHGLGLVASSLEREELASTLVSLIELVRQRPFLAEPPREYSDTATSEAFAAILDRVPARHR